MKILLCGLIFSQFVWAQSISLGNVKADQPLQQPSEQPVSKKTMGSISYVEFRDAKLANVLALIEAEGGIEGPSFKIPTVELSVRLENVSWAKLLKIILNQVTP